LPPLRRRAFALRSAASSGYEKPRHNETLSSSDLLAAAAQAKERNLDMAYLLSGAK